jgi:hypothetical protein
MRRKRLYVNAPRKNVAVKPSIKLDASETNEKLKSAVKLNVREMNEKLKRRQGNVKSRLVANAGSRRRLGNVSSRPAVNARSRSVGNVQSETPKTGQQAGKSTRKGGPNSPD